MGDHPDNLENASWGKNACGVRSEVEVEVNARRVPSQGGRDRSQAVRMRANLGHPAGPQCLLPEACLSAREEQPRPLTSGSPYLARGLALSRAQGTIAQA